MVQLEVFFQRPQIDRRRLKGDDASARTDPLRCDEGIVSDIGAHFQHDHAGLDFLPELEGAVGFMHSGQEKFPGYANVHQVQLHAAALNVPYNSTVARFNSGP